MTDYGHDLLFGAVLVPSAGRPHDAVAAARSAERAGLDLVSVPDHPYRPEFLDAWTVLASIATATSRVRVFPNVANLPLRPPAALARAAASLDLLSGGRVELGLGAGAYWDDIAAEGGPRRSPGDALTATREAVQVLRALWSARGRVRTDGKHYGLYGAAAGPSPAHDISVWIGAVGPRMLRLTGEVADGWLPSVPHVPPARLAAGHRLVDEGAEAAGRAPSAVRRLYNLSPGAQDGFPRGRPHDWPEQLAILTLESGTSAYLLPAQHEELLRVFGEEVAPATRALVAAARARPADGEEDDTAGVAPAGATRGSVAPASTEAPGADRSGTATLHARPDARPASRRRTHAVGGAADALPPLVAPTPAPAERLSGEQLWEETDRPTGPTPDSGQRYAPARRASAANLVASHDQLRADLARLREIVDEVLAEALAPGDARSGLRELSLRQNSWTLGAYCASYCRITTVHHTREDEDLFPHLRHGDPRLAPVLDRLTEEHHAIHGVIERIDRELVGWIEDGPAARPEGLRAAVDLLTDALLSHLAYEEKELIEPMARLGTGW
ncbi:LLM class flavin-dependent oxidoreductase [Streptomyces sp. NPDC090306]|uniref:LLM class flavin-dependent oxidoreductase n=1 Tax=Streptomyces sp. NPDC090306 TaxID=3365961 RepID=UPI003819CE95